MKISKSTHSQTLRSQTRRAEGVAPIDTQPPKLSFASVDSQALKVSTAPIEPPCA